MYLNQFMDFLLLDIDSTHYTEKDSQKSLLKYNNINQEIENFKTQLEKEQGRINHHESKGS